MRISVKIDLEILHISIKCVIAQINLIVINGTLITIIVQKALLKAKESF